MHPIPPQLEPRTHRLDVHVPYGCGNRSKDDPPMMTILTFDIDDVLPEDFLSQICATMGLDQQKAKIGWKSCDDKKKAPHNRLETHDDVKHAFNGFAKLLDSRRREKPVFMEVTNMVR